MDPINRTPTEAADYAALSALYGAWAAMIGDRAASARLFEEGCRPAKWTRANGEFYDNGVVYLHLTPAP